LVSLNDRSRHRRIPNALSSRQPTLGPLTPQQRTALEHPCRRPADRGHERYRHDLGGGTVLVLTVDADAEEHRGPVWHASVTASFFGDPAAWVLADRALEGVGDSARGESVEDGADGAVHVRRGLSAAEQARVATG
jgi:hypothetical protein